MALTFPAAYHKRSDFLAYVVPVYCFVAVNKFFFLLLLVIVFVNVVVKVVILSSPSSASVRFVTIYNHLY